MKGKMAVLAVAAGVFAASGHAATPAHAGPAAAKAISYARAQIGRPYLWGATGPDAFDCSGLVMMAYRAAGIRLARRSQEQWATEAKVRAVQVQSGDLVFFAGADGTMTAPGHVGIVIGHGKMIEAYATGYPVRVSSYNRPDLVGFTDPAAGGAA